MREMIVLHALSYLAGIISFCFVTLSLGQYTPRAPHDALRYFVRRSKLTNRMRVFVSQLRGCFTWQRSSRSILAWRS